MSGPDHAPPREPPGPPSGTPHAEPFYCPFCGEEDFRPGDEAGVYRCRTCDRVWRLRYLGLGGGRHDVT